MTRGNETDETIDNAILAFRRETRQRWVRFLTSALVSVVAVLCAIVGIMLKAMGIPGGMVWLGIGVIGVVGAALLITRKGRSEPKLPPHVADVRAVGALAERLDLSFGSERRWIAGLLTDLLQNVPMSEGARLARADRLRLDEALRMPDFARDADLLIAIVRAYERLGDEQSLALISALARHTGETDAERRVRQAARDSLAGLQSRIDRMRPSAELLRASDAVATPDVLLRAADHTGQSESTEILRAAEAPGN